MGDIAIRVHNVVKNFALPHQRPQSVKSVFTGFLRSHNRVETQHALRGVSFDIKKGDFFGIVGRNGSGKSTLLKMLAGIYHPTKGSIVTNGKLVPFIELGVGFNPELTGRENVYLNGALLGFSRQEIDRQYDQIVRFAELKGFMDQKLKNYSSGMQVRLAFSVATTAKADILLIDEVLAVGDADFQRKCFNYFKKLKKQKTTVVFVSHDMNAIREYCDSAVLIEDGVIVASGSADDVAEEYTKMFMVAPPAADQQAQDLQSQEEGRWGDSTMKFFGSSVQEKMLSEFTQELQFTTKFKVQQPHKGVIAGFRVKNAEGTPIIGTNTKIEKVKLPRLVNGDECSIVWRCPNIFADGEYTITLALHAADGLTAYDVWPDALSFSVRRRNNTPYIVTPPISVEVKPGNK